jgi:hypothetical protein
MFLMDARVKPVHDDSIGAENALILARADLPEPARRHEHKWNGWPNLRLRPPQPAADRDRLQTQVRRAFIAADRPEVSASTIYQWCYVRRQMRGEPVTAWYRHSVQRILREIADPVGRTKPYGAILWRLRESPKPKP